jgi:hypothetical protein
VCVRVCIRERERERETKRILSCLSTAISFTHFLSPPSVPHSRVRGRARSLPIPSFKVLGYLTQEGLERAKTCLLDPNIPYLPVCICVVVCM